MPLRQFSGRSAAARTVLRGRSNAETAATERYLTFIVAPRIDPCAIDHCADPPRDGSAACDIECGVLHRVAVNGPRPGLASVRAIRRRPFALAPTLALRGLAFVAGIATSSMSRLRPKVLRRMPVVSTGPNASCASCCRLYVELRSRRSGWIAARCRGLRRIWKFRSTL
jgi:hypothetical protein